MGDPHPPAEEDWGKGGDLLFEECIHSEIQALPRALTLREGMRALGPWARLRGWMCAPVLHRRPCGHHTLQALKRHVRMGG